MGGTRRDSYTDANVAIVCPWITRGGAERSVNVLASAFDADVLTTRDETDGEFVDPRVDVKAVLPDHTFPSSTLLSLSVLPRLVDWDRYDLFVTTSGFRPKLVTLLGTTRPIVHYEQSPTDFTGPARLVRPVDPFLTARFDSVVPNSKHTQRKLRARYDNVSDVIYPPVETDRFENRGTGDFFLSVQRFYPQKRIEIQLRAFERVDEPLVVVGSLESRAYLDRLRRVAPENVRIQPNVSEDTLLDLYGRCKAVIQTGRDEHLGLVPIEAMAAGKPSIVVDEGGFRETITPGETGVLIEPPYERTLAEAIAAFDSDDYDANTLANAAESYSVERFVRQFDDRLDSILGQSTPSA